MGRKKIGGIFFFLVCFASVPIFWILVLSFWCTHFKSLPFEHFEHLNLILVYVSVLCYFDYLFCPDRRISTHFSLSLFLRFTKRKKKRNSHAIRQSSLCVVFFFYYYRLIAHLKCQLNTTKAACSVSLPFLIPTKIFRFYFRSMELCLHLEQFVRDNFVKSKRKITTTIKNKKK